MVLDLVLIQNKHVKMQETKPKTRNSDKSAEMGNDDPKKREQEGDRR